MVSTFQLKHFRITYAIKSFLKTIKIEERKEMTTQEKQMGISQFTHVDRQGKFILRKRNIKIEYEKGY